MTKPIAPLNERPAWKALEAHHRSIRELHLRKLFADDPKRGERMTAEAVGLYLDYSKNRITDETLKLLLQLAEESGAARSASMPCSGARRSTSRKIAPSCTSPCARPRGSSIIVDGENVVPQVHAVLDKMADFSKRVRSGAWKGHTGKRIRNVINIGIGGSDLGPVMAYEALKHYSERAMTFRFVSNVDGTDFAEAVHDLDPAETLFIVSSKTFTTLETMTNAHTAREWSLAGLGGDEKSVARHFVAVSTNAAKWRSSASTPPTCSASGTGSADAIPWIRPSASRRCWRSARRISAPCWTASIRWTSTSAPRPSSATCRCSWAYWSLWYNDFFGAQTVAVLPYEQYLKRFPAYLQQLTMESNGKHVTLDGAKPAMIPGRSIGASREPTASTPSIN